MQTAREERLHELTLAYMEKDILGTKWLWTFLLLMSVGILMTVFDSVLLTLLFPAAFLGSNLRYQVKKRKILESYIGEEWASKQWWFWLIQQVVLCGVFAVLLVQTMNLSFLQMWGSIFIILFPIYFISEWWFKKRFRRDDPDFVSDQEVYKHMKSVER
ncbi:hypothetical protein [Exiguobacterium antarcticum]|uniref:hypothetical protein n=1 Tax=Exiguobacterium antarcticum TaxID=132920 RepID=UPI000285ECCA|nr:hypothetical protein [Exiguobacterium antarcticum]AFS71677.1 Hypothetical protein Eab7_2590 [Exiguobacterium antarcticum B7]